MADRHRSTKARRTRGTGSLILREYANGDVYWYGQWRDPSGKLIKRRLGLLRKPGSKTGLTKDQASGKLMDLRRDRGEQLSVAQVETMKTLRSKYEAELRRLNRKPGTIKLNLGTFDTWFVPFFSDRALTRITPEDVYDLWNAMAAGRRDGPRAKPLAIKTIHNHLALLHSIFRFAVKRRYLVDDPMRDIELPKLDEYAEIRALSMEEVRAIARAVEPGAYQLVDEVLVLTAAMTGLREGELLALWWADIFWESEVIHVKRSLSDGELVSTKGRKSREVPLNAEAAGLLHRVYQQSRATRPEHLVFTDPVRGGPLSVSMVYKRFKRAVRAAGIGDHRFHDLRHTFGATCASSGRVDMRQLQLWMGHEQLSTTERYSRFMPKPGGALLLGEVFSPAPDPIFDALAMPEPAPEAAENPV